MKTYARARSSALYLSLVAAMSRLALMPPLRFTGSKRIRFRVMCLRVARPTVTRSHREWKQNSPPLGRS